MMNIVETNIPDVHTGNIDGAKLELANQIVREVYPIFDEIYETRLGRIKDLQKELASKRRTVAQSKKELDNLNEIYRKKKKISKLLDRVDKLVQSGLAYDGTMKRDIVMLLKVIEKLSEEKIDHHLKETMNLLSRRFAK
jgi:septal ring factor EnvC (AmiA/AmiB activator)